jgi:hypothetical protein
MGIRGFRQTNDFSQPDLKKKGWAEAMVQADDKQS